MKRGLIAVIAGMHCLGLLGASVFAPVRVALLCTDPYNGDLSALEALLSAELARNPRIELLERESMTLLSEEREIELSGLVGTVFARRFAGQWLGSDTLCLLSAGRQTGAIRITVTEVRSGMRLLDDRVALAETKGGNLRAIAHAVERAINKYALPADQRVCIGVLGIRNMQPAPSLDWMENTLTELLTARLLAHPAVVIAERQQLLRTSEERRLTDPDAESFASLALIIGGRIQDVRMSGPRQARFNLRLMDIASAHAQPGLWEARGETGNLAGIIDAVCGQIIQHAINNQTGPRAGQVRMEAEMLIEQAFHMRLRNDDGAVALIEAAYIFQPANPLIADLFLRTRPTPAPHTAADAYALEYMLDHIRDAARHGLPNQRVLQHLSRVWKALVAAPSVAGTLRAPITRARRQCLEMTKAATSEFEKNPPSYESTMRVVYPRSLFSRVLAVVDPAINPASAYKDPFFDYVFNNPFYNTEISGRNRVVWAYGLSDNVDELMGRLETLLPPLLVKTGNSSDALSNGVDRFEVMDIVSPPFLGTRISKKEVYPRWIRFLERFRDADDAAARLLAEALIVQTRKDLLAAGDSREPTHLMLAMFPPPYDPCEEAVNILIRDMGYPRGKTERFDKVTSKIDAKGHLFFPREPYVQPPKTTFYSFDECPATNVEVSILFDAAAWSNVWVESRCPVDQWLRVEDGSRANNFVAVQDQHMLWVALAVALKHQEAWLIGLDLEAKITKAFWRYPVRDGSQAGGIALGEDTTYVALTGFGVAAFPGTARGGTGRLESLPVLNESDGLLSLAFGPIARVGDNLVIATHEGPFTYPGKCQSSIGIYGLKTRQLRILAASRFEKSACPFNGTGFMISSLTPMPGEDGVIFLCQGDFNEQLLYGNPDQLDGAWRLDLPSGQFCRIPIDMTMRPRIYNQGESKHDMVVLEGMSVLVEYDPFLGRAWLVSRRSNFGAFFAPVSYSLHPLPYQNAFWSVQAGKLLICPSLKDKGVFFTGDLLREGFKGYLSGLVPTPYGIVVMGQTRVGLITNTPAIYLDLLRKQ